MKILFLLLTILAFMPLAAQKYQYPFQNPSQPLEKRVADLIERLTLEEKTKLMLYNSPAIERLGIPEYNWWNECLHGVGRAGKATVFPQAIGMAATFDDQLLFKVADAISDEARAKHYAALRKGSRAQYTGLTFWTPNINIFRDPRWGRGQETYGEDPYLTGRLGSAFVKGLQGDDPKFLKTSACAKHYVVHSGPEESRHRFNALPDEVDFRDTYLPAFKTLVDAGVESVMCAYNRTYDEPCCGSKYLLDDILRKEWGFNGHIVSDCWALDDIWKRHKVVDKAVEAAVMSANAGVNLNCGYIYKYLPKAVEKGLLDESVVDDDLRYLLRTRFKLGLLDPEEKTPWSDLSEDIVDGKEHRRLAYEVAAESIVLLKNNGALPLKNPQNIFVIGELAADVTALVGNYNGFSGEMVTMLEGLVGRVDAGTVVDYSKGYLLGKDSLFNGFWQAGMADVTIACVGLNRLMEGENGDALLNPYGGDRKTIELPDNQVEFLKKLKKTISKDENHKLIVVVYGGSAIGLKEIEELADAILFVWYPGEEGGHAIADVILGDVNPSGKLPVTFYESTKDLPPFDDYSMQGRTYRFFKGKPLYSFGYGLSYSNFTISDLAIESNKLKKDEVINIEVTVTNSGEYDGEEVVQVYAKQLKSEDNSPIRSLIGFQRIFVKRGDSVKVQFNIKTSMLQSWDIDREMYRVSPGEYSIEVGNSSDNIFMEEEIKVKK
jgi:beta-glucosidase